MADQCRVLWTWMFFVDAALELGTIVRREGVASWLVAHEGPRLTDASLLDKAKDHHQVLALMESKIQSKGVLTQPRKNRLAIYYFKALQVMSRFGREHMNAGIKSIYRLNPNVDPSEGFSNKYVGLLAKVVGLKNAMNIYSAFARLRDQLNS